MEKKTTKLKEIVELIETSSEGQERVSVGMVIEALGPRTFGPILLVAGLVTLAPFPSGVPGVPTITGILVLLVTVQLLLGRKHLWLPELVAQRSLDRDKLIRAFSKIRPVIRFADKLSKPRLQVLDNTAMIHVIATICLLVAIVMPLMEIIPFSANIAGVTFTLFGMALTGHDGLLTVIGLAFLCLVVGYGLFYFVF